MSPDIEEVFADLRAKSAREPEQMSAQEQFDYARACLADGLVDEAIVALRAASRAPLLRFRVAGLLGRLARGPGLLLGLAQHRGRAG